MSSKEIKSDPMKMIVYQDEVHFQVPATRSRARHKRGSKAMVKSEPAGAKASYNGFVRPDTGEVYVAASKKFDCAAEIESIRGFRPAHPAPEGKRCIVVLDNTPRHKKAVRLVQAGQQPG